MSNALISILFQDKPQGRPMRQLDRAHVDAVTGIVTRDGDFLVFMDEGHCGIAEDDIVLVRPGLPEDFGDTALLMVHYPSGLWPEEASGNGEAPPINPDELPERSPIGAILWHGQMC